MPRHANPSALQAAAWRQLWRELLAPPSPGHKEADAAGTEIAAPPQRTPAGREGLG